MSRFRTAVLPSMLVPVVSLGLALSQTNPAAAQTSGVDAVRRDMQQMRQQYDAMLEQMRRDYEARLQSMEDRLKSAETAATGATQKADDAQKAAQKAATAAPPPPAPASANANAFNPAIGVVLDGKVTSYGKDPNSYRIPGFALGEEAGLDPRGFGLGESEVNFSASIDQWLYGNLTVAFEREGDVSVEEAFLQTTSCPRASRSRPAGSSPASATSTSSTRIPGISRTRRCPTARSSATSSAMTACSCAGWRRPNFSWSSAARCSAAIPFPPAARPIAAWARTACSSISATISARAQLSHRLVVPGDQGRRPRNGRPSSARMCSTATADRGFSTWSTNGRRTATRSTPTSSCRASISCAMRTGCSTASTIPDGRPACTCRRSISSCRAGAWACVTTRCAAIGRRCVCRHRARQSRCHAEAQQRDGRLQHQRVRPLPPAIQPR